jgi:very-short-patch-repair endonuclease
MTRSEKKFWYDGLNSHRLGFHFRRQHPFGPFFLDYFCTATQVCVELDGSSHAGREIRDENRDRHLAEAGVLTIRVMVGELEWLWGEALARIQKSCYERFGGFEYEPKQIYFEHEGELVVKSKISAVRPPPCPPPTPASQGEAVL